MTRTSFVSGLVGVATVVVCAALAVAVVACVRWLIDWAWPDAGLHTQLMFGLIAPFGVVLFAVLVEKIGWLADRTDFSAI